MVFDYSAKALAAIWLNMKTLKQFLGENLPVGKDLPFLDNVIFAEDGSVKLDEDRKWVSGRFDRNIGIDQPTYGAG